MEKLQKKRIFIALNLPANILNEVSELVNKMSRQYKGESIKWVEPDNLHITLHFLGTLDDGQIDQVKLNMHDLSKKFGQLKFSLGRINVFPSYSNPRVLFLECNQVNSKSIFKLQDLLGEKLSQIGMKIDKRQWKPHITIARIKEKIDLKLLNIKINKEFIVDSFELMESILKPAGAEYNEVISFEL